MKDINFCKVRRLYTRGFAGSLDEKGSLKRALEKSSTTL